QSHSAGSVSAAARLDARSDERRVLAAAIEAKAELIVTKNLNDFPVHVVAEFGGSQGHRCSRPCGFHWDNHQRSRLGWITCTKCEERIPIYSTGRNPERGARLLRKFIDKHRSHQ